MWFDAWRSRRTQPAESARLFIDYLRHLHRLPAIGATPTSSSYANAPARGEPAQHYWHHRTPRQADCLANGEARPSTRANRELLPRVPFFDQQVLTDARQTKLTIH